MNSLEYKEICCQQNAFKVSDLQETLIYLRRYEAKQAALVAIALMSGKVEKPRKHAGPPFDDYCLVSCTFDEADAIVDALLEAAANPLPAGGKSVAVSARPDDLVKRWSAFRETLLWLNA